MVLVGVRFSGVRLGVQPIRMLSSDCGRGVKARRRLKLLGAGSIFLQHIFEAGNQIPMKSQETKTNPGRNEYTRLILLETVIDNV